ncbi:MAG: AI-2E family transporter [Zhenhengia sp.]|uniref:AI-2E family transporter n=1 Tax=Zhenhengia yiwuensis TaxID=2763666 RepID=A0A926EGG7_9FIRM|nr:AI-2E family transporter [Zhenhengia yiwuensis]MBC8579874.1 AI-2E family transporter [Zhenhengia yiwuensis]MBS5317307.1 AI-2E family transporter [Clostridiales bacterium]MDU6854987.1 AI-2E family transporter [Clostridiales bacterium]MDU6974811.1 AI-2E family transporter [Clostridiales bacterium]
MKKIWDTYYVKIALYTLFVIVAAILVYRISSNTDNIIPHVYAYIKSIIAIFTPILYGLLIAYLLNPAVAFFERYLIKWTHSTTFKDFKRLRLLSIIIVYICIFGTLFLTIRFLVPQILDNIKVLFNNLPTYLDELKDIIAQLQHTINQNISYPDVTQFVNEIINPSKVSHLVDFASLSKAFDHVISGTMNLTGTILNLIIGIMIASYAVMQKETFTNGSKRLIYALFRQNTANKIISIASESHTTIIRFFVGKSLDSLIIGIICFIVLSIMKNPYALLLSFIVGLFNMIPYFGPFIGAVPAVILTLFEGIPAAIGVAIFIFLLQQFDGLYLGPKILGESIGITPFWIISAITVGGAIAGPLGMFFASPILAVILSITNRWIDKRLNTKRIDLPKLSPDEIVPHTPPHFNNPGE